MCAKQSEWLLDIKQVTWKWSWPLVFTPVHMCMYTCAIIGSCLLRLGSSNRNAISFKSNAFWSWHWMVQKWLICDDSQGAYLEVGQVGSCQGHPTPHKNRTTPLWLGVAKSLLALSPGGYALGHVGSHWQSMKGAEKQTCWVSGSWSGGGGEWQYISLPRLQRRLGVSLMPLACIHIFVCNK